MALPPLAKRDDHDDDDDGRRRSGPPILIIVFIVIVVLFIIAIAVVLVLRHLRARQLGLPTNWNPFGRSSAPARSNYPAGGSSGPLSWFKDRIDAFRNRRHRTAGGAYEEPLGGVGGRAAHRGFGPLDPDEAWDSRVGAEADSYGPGGYYEEQELGLHRGPTNLHSSAEYDGANSALSRSHEADDDDYDDDMARGRTRKALDDRYDEEMGRSGHGDPFGDTAEPSHMRLRELSPMPADAAGGSSGPAARPDDHDARLGRLR